MDPFLKGNPWIERHAQNLATRDQLHSHVDLLLHPRRPPFVRTLPFVDSLSLSSAEENAEETKTRQSLDLAFGNGEIRSITSEPQTHHEPAIQSFMTLEQQTPLNPPQERASATSIGLLPQTASETNGNLSVETPAPSVATVAPPLQAVSDLPAGPPLLISQKGPAPSVFGVPMLVDEFEEVPAIDLGSDSDA